MKTVTRKARSTGTNVTLGSAIDLGLDDGDGEMKWYTICDVHGTAIGHRTYHLALSWSSAPEQFCEFCARPDEWCSVCENSIDSCGHDEVPPTPAKSTTKAACSVCRKKHSVDDLATGNKRRSGSYNRAGSWITGRVCRSCTASAIEATRFNRYRDGRVWNCCLDDQGVKWSTAADTFGLDYSDVPRNYRDVERDPVRYNQPINTETGDK